MQSGRNDLGETPKNSKDSSAAPIRIKIPAARRLDGVSAITRMPRNFETA